MPSLESLFFAAAYGGDPCWYTMAVSHALKTAQNNVRADGSTYQGVEYSSDGSVYTYFTNDGAGADSTWSRGQAWGIYGFTMTYRYTHDPRFLKTAQQLADYFIANLSPDYVPVWDFTKPWTDPHDSSAAAIAVAALLELSGYVIDSTKLAYYHDAAMNIQSSLSNPALYLGDTTTTDGILLHGTYGVPSNTSVNTSLIWGDYYFVQGCFRAMSAPA
jgi:unsaturated chondroitin disaccharide hydrolase